MDKFTKTTLPKAIRRLFELNQYSVEGPIRLHGAEIDLVARPDTDPFGAPIYIEATTEYVDNTKYGKDLTKFIIISQTDPQAVKLIVSSSGFTVPVVERARGARIQTLTYQDLFRKFERFEPYISSFLGDTPSGRELRQLSTIYEEPIFSDAHGSEKATSFLTDWKNSTSHGGQWLLVTGEYGTGKTALTRVLLHRWLSDYQTDPNLPLPLRIELRDFTSQFNARGLLYDFLDQHNLSHISVDFVRSLIQGGRAVLILDGYDEMAQYLHTRERRTCLQALAELSTGGAKGLITSRPNYFTEAEELQIYEILYKSLEAGRYTIGRDAAALLEREKQVDDLLEQFIDRFERTLKDLTPEQTEDLIKRVLSNDPDGQAVVVGLLKRLFRPSDNHDALSLAGKPVIVSYLLDVVEDLKASTTPNAGQTLTEYEIYKLIIDHLMVRDARRSTEILPNRRREFLQRVAVFLSRREHPYLSEDDFRDIVAKDFQRDLIRLPKDGQNEQLERLFADLRSSATLTRGGPGTQYSWRFSHNSLREYLVAEALIEGLERNRVVTEPVTISDAMRIFAASIPLRRLETLRGQLAHAWVDSSIFRGRGQLLTLLWDGLLRLYPKDMNRHDMCMKQLAGNPPQLTELVLASMTVSTEESPVSFEGADFSCSQLSTLTFSAANLADTKFSGAVLDGVTFENARLEGSTFDDALIIETDFSGADVRGTNFTGLDRDAISIVVELGNERPRTVLSGQDALGYLKFMGAMTDTIPINFVLQFHPAFWVVDKIVSKLATQSTRQRRGIEQRGAAHRDVNLAKEFVRHLEYSGLLTTAKARKDLVDVTEQGRRVFSKYAADRELSEELLSFFEDSSTTFFRT